MERSLKIKKVTGLAIFTGLVVCLQLFSNYITFGAVSITLALIPIAVGAILYGPFAGLFLGLVCGILTFVAPSTISTFWPLGVFKTLVVCLLKMGAAGFVAGLIYKTLNKKNQNIATILTSISVPLINTGLFALCSYLLFNDFLVSLAGGENTLSFLLFSFIGVNFLFEFVINSFLSPAVLRLVNIIKSND